MLTKYIMLLVILFSVYLAGCSAPQEISDNTETENDNTYVFDEIPVDSTIKVEPKEVVRETNKASHYVVQIGAFTTRQKAELFLKKSKEIISDDILVDYSHEVNLFVVQLSEKFINKNDAVKKRNSLKIREEFKDAWVVTVY